MILKSRSEKDEEEKERIEKLEAGDKICKNLKRAFYVQYNLYCCIIAETSFKFLKH